MHFATKNKGHRQTKVPGQGKASDSELEGMNIHAGSYTISQLQEYYIFLGILERCNKQKHSSLLKNRKIHVCALLPLQTYFLDLLAELATRALLTYFSQNKLVSKDLLFKLSKLKHLILTESRFAVLLTDPGGQQPAAARRRLSGILLHQYI